MSKLSEKITKLTSNFRWQFPRVANAPPINSVHTEEEYQLDNKQKSTLVAKIGILGSCVTRDTFNFFPQNITLFVSRTSLISIMSPPLYCPEDLLNLKSNFQKQAVLNDVSKNFFFLLEKFNPDILIVDFIDERFHIIKIGKSYITKSVQLVDSGLCGNYWREYQEIDRYSDDMDALWKNSCMLFCKQLKRIFDPQKILLHKAYACSRYVDDENKVKTLDAPKFKFVTKFNRILEKYYSFFEGHLGCNSYSVSEKHQIAYANHRWGLAPYHYIHEYYYEFYRYLSKFTNSVLRKV